MAQQCNLSVEHWRRGMFPSAAEEAAVVVTPSLRCVPCVQGSEKGASLRLNLGHHCNHDAQGVQRVGALSEQSDSPGMHLAGVQDGEICYV